MARKVVDARADSDGNITHVRLEGFFLPLIEAVTHAVGRLQRSAQQQRRPARAVPAFLVNKRRGSPQWRGLGIGALWAMNLIAAAGCSGEDRPPSKNFQPADGVHVVLSEGTPIIIPSDERSSWAGLLGSLYFNPQTNTIFALDRVNSRVSEFDSLGNFVRSFGTEGEGPGELTTPTSYAVRGAEVWVLDVGAGKMVVFGMDGTLSREFRLDYIYQAFGFLEDGSPILVRRHGRPGVERTEPIFHLYSNDGEFIMPLGNVEFGPELCIFCAVFPRADSSFFFVDAKDGFVIESNLNGRVLNKLDLAKLESVVRDWRAAYAEMEAEAAPGTRAIHPVAVQPTAYSSDVVGMVIRHPIIVESGWEYWLVDLTTEAVLRIAFDSPNLGASVAVGNYLIATDMTDGTVVRYDFSINEALGMLDRQ